MPAHESIQLISDASSAALHEKPAGKNHANRCAMEKLHFLQPVVDDARSNRFDCVLQASAARLSLGCKINLDNVPRIYIGFAQSETPDMRRCRALRFIARRR